MGLGIGTSWWRGKLYPDANVWRKVPRWHPMFWLGGQEWRRWRYEDYSIGGEYDGCYQYATTQEKARIFIEELYNGGS